MQLKVSQYGVYQDYQGDLKASLAGGVCSFYVPMFFCISTIVFAYVTLIKSTQSQFPRYRFLWRAAGAVQQEQQELGIWMKAIACPCIGIMAPQDGGSVPGAPSQTPSSIAQPLPSV